MTVLGWWVDPADVLALAAAAVVAWSVVYGGRG